MTIPPDDQARLQRRYERERAARREAESIAERVTGELYAKNREVERANAELEAANQTLKDFVAVAAHDLRGPVSAIMGFASTMLRAWEKFSEQEKQEYVSIIERRGVHLSRMLDSLLTVSKIESGALEIHREEIAVADAIALALEDVGELASQVQVRCPDDLAVMADPDHLQRILVNYISNAFKYGAPPVEVEARPVDGFIEVVVSDLGDGVPADFASRLFHKFARADSAATRKEKGTGLGLSIVQGLAQANSGDAWYEANRPHGSRFGVRLPTKSAA
jgi:signal transduction histidine kinase